MSRRTKSDSVYTEFEDIHLYVSTNIIHSQCIRLPTKVRYIFIDDTELMISVNDQGIHVSRIINDIQVSKTTISSLAEFRLLYAQTKTT